MNKLQRIESICDALGLRFRTVGDLVILRFVAPEATLVIRARDLVVTIDRPCGVVLRSALAAAICEANHVNTELLLMGAFAVREHDRLLTYRLPLVAPVGLTPEQLDIGISAAVLNPYPDRFTPYLEARVGDLDGDGWWHGVA